MDHPTLENLLITNPSQYTCHGLTLTFHNTIISDATLDEVERICYRG